MGRENKIILLIIASSALSIVEAFRFIGLYHHSIPFWDQWGYLTPYFEDSSWVDGFLFQQGSHFLGLGYFTSLLSGKIFNFSMAGEGYFVAVFMLVNSILTISLKKKLSGTLHWFDAFIPPLFVYVGFTEIFTHLAYAPVVALPIMSTLVFAHFLLIPNSRKKFTALTILFITSIFTGYAFITSGLILAYTLFYVTTSSDRKYAALSLLPQLLTILLFAKFYEVPKASICIINEGQRPYLTYWLNLVMHSFGGEIRLRDITLVLAAITIPIGATFKRVKAPSSLIFPLLALLGFSGGYSILNTLSRACMGVETALAPRYGAFLLLGILTIYLLFSLTSTENKTRLFIASIGFFGCIYFLKFHKIDHFYRSAEKNKVAVEAWMQCYESSHSFEACDSPQLKNPFAPSQYERANGFLKSYAELKGN